MNLVKPQVVRFTGLEFDPDAVIGPERMHRGPIPANWYRYQFRLPEAEVDCDRRFEKWMEANTLGRWAYYLFPDDLRLSFVVFFEDQSDALHFRMSDGHFAWISETA